jgi:HK97 family phage prohead protease
MRNPGQFQIGGSGFPAARGVHASRLAASGAAEQTMLSGILCSYDPAEVGFDDEGVPTIYRPGSFSESLKTKDLRLLFAFDPGFVLGRNRAGTLHFSDGPKALRFTCLLPNTTWCGDLLANLRRGDVTAMAFRSRAITSKLERRQGRTVRIVSKTELLLTSITAFGGFEGGDLEITGEQAFDSKFLAKLGIANRLYQRARGRLLRDR